MHLRQLGFLKNEKKSLNKKTKKKETSKKILVNKKMTVDNTLLYNEVKEEAKRKFERYPSAYSSMWISKQYQERGGTYSGVKTNRLKRWRDEQWVQVVPYLTDGKKITCGSSNKNTKVCRPLKRINKSTPTTIKELLKKYDKQQLLDLAQKKNNDMAGRVYWDSLKFVASNKRKKK